MKSNYTEQRFQMNRDTSVVVKDKEKHGVHHTTVTLMHNVVSLEFFQLMTLAGQQKIAGEE